MPMNFDEKRQGKPRRSVEDRTFTLTGRTMVVRDRVRPEALLPMDRMRDPVRNFRECVCGHPPQNHPVDKCSAVGCTCAKMRPAVTDPGSSLAEDLGALDETIEGLLEPDSVDLYRAARADEFDPVGTDDLLDLITWITAGEAARPTGRPGVSSPGPQSTATPSTAGSSSQGIQAA